MSTYNSNHTGAQLDEALNKALNPDTTPSTGSSNLVTSGAVKDYVDGKTSTKLDTSLKGAKSGLAELDASGKVPSSQLPAYVDDVLEYAAKANFPTTGETGKIYVDKTTNLTYRWSGSAYVEISPSLALGETSSTAYRGDRGKIAYDHSQLTSGNPHKVTKSDVGLGNVENKSSATIRGEITSSNVTTALGFTPTSLALGETSTTAYRGDNGKTAYTHSQLKDGSNPHATTFANIASKPTTISGYGITDAKISSGTITLGSNSITPLTSSSSLDATKLTGTATINTTGKATTAGTADALKGVTATAAELNILDGATLTTTELNYVDGVTSNIQTQLNNKAASSHTHNYAGSTSAGGAATKATQDSAGQQINTTYLKNVSVPGQTVTITKGNGTTSTVQGFTVTPTNNTSNTWTKLGTFNNTVQGNGGEIWLFGGQGQNSSTYQNMWAHLFIKKGYQSTASTTNYVAATYEIFTPPGQASKYKDVKFKVFCKELGKVDVWVYFPYNYPRSYYYPAGMYDSFTVANTQQTEEPVGGSTYGVLQPIAGGVIAASSNGTSIDDTIKGLSISGKTITYTKGNDTTGTLTTQDTTYSNATTSAAGLMSASDKTKLDGIATGANKYTLPVATSSALGGIKSGTDITIDANGNVSVNDSSHNHAASNITSGTLSSDRLPTVPITKGGTGATTAAAALTNLGLTATAAELNYVDGVTSNVQTQLNAKAIKPKTYTATIPTTGWTTSAPYYVDVTVTGILASDIPLITPTYSGTLGTDLTIRENWGTIDRIETYANKIRIYAFEEIPTATIPLQIVVVR